MPRTAKSAPVATPRKGSARPGGRVLPKPTPVPGEPLYRQLVQALRGEILRGSFPVGSQLPTEEELTARFSVSRHTVREALRQLRADGLVSSRQGSGTTVTAPPPSTPFNVHRVASIDELIAYATETRYVVDSAGFVDSGEIAAEELGLPPRQRWLRLRGFRHAEAPKATQATPVCWTEVFVAAEYAGVQRLLERQRGPIWRLIEDIYGERLVEVEQNLRVTTAPAEVAAGLGLDHPATVVEVRRTYRTTADRIAEVSVNLYPADQFRFSMKLRRA